jgi:hypothetical protein
MKNYDICTACGTQYATRREASELCPICADDRQFIPETGQVWTDLGELSDKYGVIVKKVTGKLYELKMAPTFAIGQRALLVLSPEGNILWDCIPLLNESTVSMIRALGGLKAIAFSHPHYYSTMNVWAETFECPVYIHKSDEQWVFHKGNRVRLWEGIEQELWDGIRIINIGGHFPGSSILHVPFLSPEGAILTGDTFALSPSKKHLAVMYSYPNRIPLPIREVQRIKDQMLNLRFDSLHGFYDYQNIYSDAKQLLDSSLARYK